VFSFTILAQSVPSGENMDESSSTLERPQYAMPAFIEEALLLCGLMDAYGDRPAYQQNDYIGWILRAKRRQTQEKRLNQMLNELEQGDKYMKMDYHTQK
jgi:hypothetical protein